MKYLYGIQIRVQVLAADTYVIMQFSKENLAQFSKYKQVADIKQMLLRSEAALSLGFSIKNGFQELLAQPSQEFVKWLLAGFILESTLDINKQFLSCLQQKLHQNAGGLETGVRYALLSLLQQSKMHVTFKDVEDVNQLFEYLGIDALAKESPNNSDMVQECRRLLQGLNLLHVDAVSGGTKQSTYQVMLRKFLETIAKYKSDEIELMGLLEGISFDIELTSPGLISLLTEIGVTTKDQQAH